MRDISRWPRRFPYVFDGAKMEVKDITTKQLRQHQRAEAQDKLDAAPTNCDVNDIPENIIAANVSLGRRDVASIVIELRQARLPYYVVAPYEADTQLAWLRKSVTSRKAS